MAPLKIAVIATVIAGVMPLVALAQSGEEIYKGTCIACHGDNGKGTFDGIPDLTGKNGRLAKSTDAVHIKHIMNGLESPGSQMAMPANGGGDTLTKEEAEKVLKYLKDNFGNKIEGKKP